MILLTLSFEKQKVSFENKSNTEQWITCKESSESMDSSLKCGNSGEVISCANKGCSGFICTIEPDLEKDEFQSIKVKMTFLSAKAEPKLYSICTHVEIPSEGTFLSFNIFHRCPEQNQYPCQLQP